LLERKEREMGGKGRERKGGREGERERVAM
jgi:hypothetical protein